jgi:hypothetical protein
VFFVLNWRKFNLKTNGFQPINTKEIFNEKKWPKFAIIIITIIIITFKSRM